MTIERLNQYRHLVREIGQLEAALKKIDTPTLRDSVLSSDGPGCTLREISVYGTPGGKRRLQARYRRRLDKLEKERDAIEAYIDSVSDSYMRQVISLRFVSGHSWEQVADHIGGTAESNRMACKRFMGRV